MKTKKTFFWFTIISIFSFSCSESLLDINPKNSKVISNFFKDEAQLQEGIVGAYAFLQTDGQYNLANLVLGELPSDDTWDEVPANDGGNYGQLDLFNMTSSNTIIKSSWSDNYQGIQQCNLVLNRIENVSMAEDAKNIAKGEVFFLRALMYFNLVRIFGDIPLVIEETVNPNDFFGQGRTDKGEVYKQIKSDLETAVSLLPETASERGHATKGAAYALQGKVYLTEGDYNSAFACFQKIEKLGYLLLDDVEDIFDVDNKDNKEIIFAVQFESGVKGNTEGSSAFQMFSPSGSVNGAKGHNLPTTEIYDLVNGNDKRKSAYFRVTESGVIGTAKLKQTSITVEDGGSNIIVFRYADIILMMAECYAYNNDISNANTYLNKIKIRAGLEVVNINEITALKNEIELERRKELVGEGHRWFDLIRTGKAVETMNNYFKRTPGYAGITITSDNLIQPIPQGQIDTDPSIVQNPGYN